MDKKELLSRIYYGTGVTHPSTFHADDILSTCLLRLIHPNITIIRSNVIPDDFPGLVYDIGFGDYDHHQCNAKVRRSSGIPYAAFGLLWNDLSHLFMDEIHAERFDAAFVSEIDRCDNSSDTNLLSSSIELFNATWNGGESPDVQFEKAVSVFTVVLESLIQYFKTSTYVPRYCDMNECLNKAFESIYVQRTKKQMEVSYFTNIKDVWETYYDSITPNESPDFFNRTFLSQINRSYGKYKTTPFVIAMTCLGKVERVMTLTEIMMRRFSHINAKEPARRRCEKIYQESERKDLIILDRYIPYDSITENHETVKAILFPSDRRGYTILCANMNQDEKQKNGFNLKKVCRRMEFPVELRGKEIEVLTKEYSGLFFVHPSGFMASCDTLDQAILFYENINK